MIDTVVVIVVLVMMVSVVTVCGSVSIRDCRYAMWRMNFGFVGLVCIQ